MDNDIGMYMDKKIEPWVATMMQMDPEWSSKRTDWKSTLMSLLFRPRAYNLMPSEYFALIVLVGLLDFVKSAHESDNN